MKKLIITSLLFIMLIAPPLFAGGDGSNKTELSNQILVLIGQRYIPSYLSPFNWRDGKTPHTLVYVIGNNMGKEFFTFPVPDTEDKWMSPKEAERYNNETNEK